jgi:transcriptional regulator with XRE-family HTH domain
MNLLLSSRADGRGHWPKGRLRHTGLKLSGWKSVNDFLARVWALAQERHLLQPLAEELGVSRVTIWRWRQHLSLPSQAHLDQMVLWYRRQKEETKL